MANGYAMASIIGTETVMSSAQSTFISSTNWTERIGPVAALATMKKYIHENVAEHIINIGDAVKKVWLTNSEKHKININVSGLPTLASFSFNNEKNQAMMTYFTIEMLKSGFLGFRQFKSSFAHSFDDVVKYEIAVDEVFEKIANNSINDLLNSPIAHTGLHRLTKE